MGSPKVVRRFVSFELRRLRDAKGLTAAAVAKHLGCDPSRVTQFETTYSMPSVPFLESMLRLYEVEDRFEAFRQLLESVKKKKDWWLDQFDGATPEWFDLWLGMESMATQIHSYNAMLVPGLFQTPEYAKALMDVGEPGLPEHEIVRQVDLRMARQDILTRDADPPTVWAVLDETVLLRRVGSERVMRQQIEHLLKLTDLPNVTIQLLPLSAGMHIGMDGTFTILDFPVEMVDDPGVVYTQTRANAAYHEEREHIRRFRDTLTHLQIQALDSTQTCHQLTAEIKEL